MFSLVLLISLKRIEDVILRYHDRLANQSNQYNAYYTAAYDAVMAIAMTLNKSISILKTQGKTLGNFSHVDKDTSSLFKDILLNLTFNGMTVSMARSFVSMP